MVLSMRRGDIDLVPYVSAVRDIQMLQKTEGLTVSDKGSDGFGALNWLAFNTKKPPFDNPDVRRAIGYAIDKKFILDRLLGGVAQRAYGPIVPTSPLATDQVEHYDLDLAKAKDLLDKAGLKPGADGVRLKMTADYIPGFTDQGRNIVEYLRTQLRQVGIEVEVRNSPDFPTWAQRISNYDFDVTEDNVYNWGDPVIGVNRTYVSSNIRKGVIWSNTQQYSNPEVDRILEQAGQEMDPAKRAALYAEFQKIVVDDAPILYLNVTPFNTVYKSNLKNPPLTIWGAASPLDEVYWDKK